MALSKERKRLLSKYQSNLGKADLVGLLEVAALFEEAFTTEPSITWLVPDAQGNLIIDNNDNSINTEYRLLVDKNIAIRIPISLQTAFDDGIEILMINSGPGWTITWHPDFYFQSGNLPSHDASDGALNELRIEIVPFGPNQTDVYTGSINQINYSKYVYP